MKIIKFGILFLLILTQVACAKKIKEKPPETVTVTRGNISASISSTGTVEPRNRLEIKPPVAGRVEKILVTEGQSVHSGQTLAWMSSSDRAALIDAARAKGPEEIKYWENVYQPAPVVAPLAGFIIQRSVEPGQSLGVSDPLLVMADRLIVKAQVDETDIGRIHLNQKVEIILDAYPDEKVSGRVEQIAYESKIISNVTVYEINIVSEKLPEFFRAGMSATVNFLQEEKDNVLLLPIRAIKKLNGTVLVFVKDADQKTPRTIKVQIGLESSENVEIISGLAEGDQVLVPTAQMIQSLRTSGRPRGPMNLFSRPTPAR